MKKKEASLFRLLEVKKKSKHLSWIERKMYKRLLPYYTHYTDEVYKARDRKAVTDDGTVFKTKEGRTLEKSFLNKNLVLTKTGEKELIDLKMGWMKEYLNQSFGWIPKKVIELILQYLSVVLIALYLLYFVL